VEAVEQGDVSISAAAFAGVGCDRRRSALNGPGRPLAFGATRVAAGPGLGVLGLLAGRGGGLGHATYPDPRIRGNLLFGEALCPCRAMRDNLLVPLRAGGKLRQGNPVCQRIM